MTKRLFKVQERFKSGLLGHLPEPNLLDYVENFFAGHGYCIWTNKKLDKYILGGGKNDPKYDREDVPAFLNAAANEVLWIRLGIFVGNAIDNMQFKDLQNAKNHEELELTFADANRPVIFVFLCLVSNQEYHELSSVIDKEFHAHQEQMTYFKDECLSMSKLCDAGHQRLAEKSNVFQSIGVTAGSTLSDEVIALNILLKDKTIQRYFADSNQRLMIHAECGEHGLFSEWVRSELSVFMEATAKLAGVCFFDNVMFQLNKVNFDKKMLSPETREQIDQLKVRSVDVRSQYNVGATISDMVHKHVVQVTAALLTELRLVFKKERKRLRNME